MECSCAYGGHVEAKVRLLGTVVLVMLPGALRVGDIGLVATIAAKMAAVMLVLVVLLLAAGGICLVGNDAAAGVGAAVLVVLVLCSLETSAG